ncbi:hypothetical protein CC1G_10918 [Coprinopsis cinerea okayama7|uniref:Uncharacterized protein n=1 Tax=Coprinopsis cinerea (strain Okayama-7 / 130 / ATCC MYA-4618 / FGSC 9003) TaxID=240176 RepID=A8NT19_COPC7|nr:hypothetical protein CC1G_10918 [Coprinopsis cinerea okayama7\|eukprot:XP_001836137.2 hypothetical protein CC1G_10918 [Coprinopsis cinerea okayama7\
MSILAWVTQILQVDSSLRRHEALRLDVHSCDIVIWCGVNVVEEIVLRDWS